MFNEFDVPILQNIYDLYKTFYGFRLTVNKQGRYTIWQKSENLILEILELILLASQQSKINKVPTLERASAKLNFLRVFIRLMKDIKIIDQKKYILFQEDIDKIGRMLGGWLKSSKEL